MEERERPVHNRNRYGTELDRWLEHNAPRFHFEKTHEWVAWHRGYTLNWRIGPA
jgi:hypothetical protein